VANPYPAVFRDDNSETRLSGKVDFTDPANQPGGGNGPTVLGPYTVNYNTAGFATDGAVLRTLSAGSLILNVAVVIDTAWDVAGSMIVALGGSDYGPPNDDFLTLITIADIQTIATSYSLGVGVAAPVLDGALPLDGRARFGYISTSGALVANTGAIGAAAGSLRVWALAVLP
jgi:hypothetical protein